MKAYSAGDRLFLTINNIFLGVILAGVLFPILHIIAASFSNPDAVLTGRVWLFPVQFSLDGYKTIFASDSIMKGYLNSLFYMTAGTSLNVSLTLLAAYPLSRRDFRGRNVFMFLFAFTMYFNGGMVPTFLTVRNLGLLNSRAAMILPGAVSVWNIIITRTYFQNDIPKELFEAAQIDGCSNGRFFLRCVLPLSKAIIAVNILFYAVGHWNAFMSAVMYLYDPNKFPLQIVLRSILINENIDNSMIDYMELAMRIKMMDLIKYAVIVVASAPLMVLYPFVQKYFIRGVMIGSLKD
jgi:multiple sugar transport system permease protein/putative aldouronate transport system permease protein